MIEFKIGDIIICKKNCVFEQSYGIATVENKSYEIVDIDDSEFYIKNDMGFNHSFDFDKNSESYYGIWFCTKKEYRKLKLKKLNLL